MLCEFYLNKKEKELTGSTYDLNWLKNIVQVFSSVFFFFLSRYFIQFFFFPNEKGIHIFEYTINILQYIFILDLLWWTTNRFAQLKHLWSPAMNLWSYSATCYGAIFYLVFCLCIHSLSVVSVFFGTGLTHCNISVLLDL